MGSAIEVPVCAKKPEKPVIGKVDFPTGQCGIIGYGGGHDIHGGRTCAAPAGIAAKVARGAGAMLLVNTQVGLISSGICSIYR